MGELYPCPSHGWKGPRHLSHPVFYRGISGKLESKAEQQTQTIPLIWVARIASSGLTHYATTLAPHAELCIFHECF